MGNNRDVLYPSPSLSITGFLLLRMLSWADANKVVQLDRDSRGSVRNISQVFLLLFKNFQYPKPKAGRYIRNLIRTDNNSVRSGPFFLSTTVAKIIKVKDPFHARQRTIQIYFFEKDLFLTFISEIRENIYTHYREFHAFGIESVGKKTGNLMSKNCSNRSEYAIGMFH